MMNITISGNIGKDAETRRLQDGNMVTSFSVAVAGVGRDATSTWFDVSIFGQRGEGAAQYLRKGGFVSVAGRFGTRLHEGKTYLQVNASDFTFGPKRADAGDSPAPARSAPQARKPAPVDEFTDDGDLIPF